MTPPDWTDQIPEIRAVYPALVKAVRFPPGRIALTPGAAEALQENKACSLLDYLIRHLTGDWGDLDAPDREANEQALANSLRLLSSYSLPDGRTLWIITEADRSATTALTPEEY